MRKAFRPCPCFGGYCAPKMCPNPKGERRKMIRKEREDRDVIVKDGRVYRAKDA